MNDEDRARIEAAAEATRLTLSDFMRSVALNVRIKSAYDLEAVRALAKVNGDLGRLGGLLKMWLADSPGVGAREGDVQQLLEEIRTTAAEVREGMQRV
ncbi:conjugal transfer protein TraJ [Sphingomonas sp. ABOLF]|uniref:plasmid mobilization protein n=1 Tax=Sphingomonas sp. ABOLF TaxID=1985879 RepID=UPI000F7F5AA8|nr:conjugal transfer protein TraJ [Sphingomonas sp. ABOLF]